MNHDRHDLNSHGAYKPCPFRRAGSAPHQSVTVLITRRPRKSSQKEFEQALSDTIDAALEFPGHLGVTVLKPQTVVSPQGLNTRVKHRCGRLFGFTDRLFCEKSGIEYKSIE